MRTFDDEVAIAVGQLHLARIAAYSPGHAFCVSLKKLTSPLPTKDGGTLRTILEACARRCWFDFTGCGMCYQELNMPIRSSLERDHSFGPEDIARLSAAFKAALGKLGLVARKDPATTAVAKPTWQLVDTSDKHIIFRHLGYYSEILMPGSKSGPARPGGLSCPRRARTPGASRLRHHVGTSGLSPAKGKG
jgi:hypothetical protein